jgi:hypothetical protein
MMTAGGGIAAYTTVASVVTLSCKTHRSYACKTHIVSVVNEMLDAHDIKVHFCYEVFQELH